MVFVVIRLVGEAEDRLFDNIILEPQIHVDDLIKEVESVTNIPPKFQQIEFRSEELPDSLHPLESINDFEEIVVKHAFLDTWSAYLFLCKSAKDMKKAKPERTKCAQRAIANSKQLEDSGFFEKHALLSTWSAYLEYCKNVNDMKKARPERTKFAHQAIAFSKALEDSGFLIVYTTFGAQWRDTIGQMMRFVDRTQNALKQSATTFFSKMYPNSKINFKPKQGGTRAGIVVTVTCNEEETIYYMKTYHHASSSMSLRNTSKRHLPVPDLREMFAYRLLELIGVGPVVFFPFYAGSTYIHYIATKEVSGFKELEKLEDVSLQNKVVVEAYLLSLILGIRDLNEGNIGSSEEKTLSIIDFYVPDTDNFLRRRILDDLKNKSNFGGLGKANEILAEIGHEERMKVAKNALPHWSRINSMTSDIIDREKSELREHGIKFGTATNDVDNYLQDIKLNYDSICSAFQ